MQPAAWYCTLLQLPVTVLHYYDCCSIVPALSGTDVLYGAATVTVVVQCAATDVLYGAGATATAFARLLQMQHASTDCGTARVLLPQRSRVSERPARLASSPPRKPPFSWPQVTASLRACYAESVTDLQRRPVVPTLSPVLKGALGLCAAYAVSGTDTTVLSSYLLRCVRY